MAYWLKTALFTTILKPAVKLLLSPSIEGLEHLERPGPFLIAPNHNSHLDTIVTISLFCTKRLGKVRPVAAADYFFTNPIKAWLVTNLLGILPIDRVGGDHEGFVEKCNEALDRGEILIIFPEGSRGKPEQLGQVKKGIYHLLAQRKQPVPVIPVHFRGLGKSMPKGVVTLCPLNCQITIGPPLGESQSAEHFKAQVSEHYRSCEAPGAQPAPSLG